MFGYNEMPVIFANAPYDIKSHLWSLYWLVRMLNAKKTVELGVRSGDSTRALLAGIHDIGGKLVSFDIDGDAYRVPEVSAKMGLSWEGVTWECYKGDSATAGRNWAGGTLDLVFIDTDHTIETTYNEINAWRDHVRPGGALAFHDTGLKDAPRDGVRPAIDRFLAEGHPEWKLEDHPHVAEGDTGLGILWRNNG